MPGKGPEVTQLVLVVPSLGFPTAGSRAGDARTRETPGNVLSKQRPQTWAVRMEAISSKAALSDFEKRSVSTFSPREGSLGRLNPLC